MSAFLDLVGLPYALHGTDPETGVDCLWATREAMRRIFPDFDGVEMPSTPAEIAEALAGEGAARRLVKVGTSSAAAKRRGDVLQIETREESGAVHPGVACLIDPVGRIVLTALPKPGVVLIPVRKLGRVVGVWRRA